MTSSSTPVRRRWFHFTIGRMMIALPLIALAIIIVAGIDPFRPDPNQQAIDQSIRFCAAPTHTFSSAREYDRSNLDTGHLLNKPRLVDGTCVLKMSKPGTVLSSRQGIVTFGSSEALAEDGRFQHQFRGSISTGTSKSTIFSEQMLSIKKILSSMPESQSNIPMESEEFASGIYPGLGKVQITFESRALVIGFREQGVWVTRVYDKGQAPPEIVALVKALEHRIE